VWAACARRSPSPFSPADALNSPLLFTRAALAAAATSAGAAPAEVRATVRHLVVVGGYAHCLAATNALVAGGVRDEDGLGGGGEGWG
jgi:hypothetical protein